MLSLLPRLLFRLLTECVLKTEKGSRRRKRKSKREKGSRKRKGSSTSSKRGTNVRGRERKRESGRKGRNLLSKEGKEGRKGKGRWWMNVLQDISNTKVLSHLFQAYILSFILASVEQF